MTQIIVNLNNGASVQTIRRAIALLRGVASTTLIKTKTDNERKTLAQQEYVKQTLTRALGEVKEAKRTSNKLKSLDDFLAEQQQETAV